MNSVFDVGCVFLFLLFCLVGCFCWGFCWGVWFDFGCGLVLVWCLVGFGLGGFFFFIFLVLLVVGVFFTLFFLLWILSSSFGGVWGFWGCGGFSSSISPIFGLLVYKVLLRTCSMSCRPKFLCACAFRSPSSRCFLFNNFSFSFVPSFAIRSVAPRFSVTFRALRHRDCAMPSDLLFGDPLRPPPCSAHSGGSSNLSSSPNTKMASPLWSTLHSSLPSK